MVQNMYILSIHPDGDYFKVALLSQKGKKMKIEFINDLRKEITDLNQLKRKIDAATKLKDDSVEVVSALGPEEVFSRQLELPLKRKRAVMKALPFQLESVLPFSQEHSTTLCMIKKRSKASLVHLYSFLNETMDEHIQNVRTFGFTPDWVSTVPRGLRRFVETFGAISGSCMVFHFGWARSYLVTIVDGDEVFSTTISVGLKNFIDALKDDLATSEEISLGILEVEIEKSVRSKETDTEIGRILFEVQSQIYRNIEFLKRQGSFAESQGVVFTGYVEIVRKISNWVEMFPSKIIELVPHLEYETKEVSAYAIEIGLAIDCMERDDETLQLRVGRFVPKRLYTKVKKKMALVAALSCLTSVLALSAVISYHIKREVNLKERFMRIVQMSNADIERFAFLEKTFVGREEINRGIQELVKGLKNVKKENMLSAPPIQVHETFEWLYPHLIQGIELKKIHYELLSNPSIERPDIDYLIKYTLVFKPDTEETAQTFYDRLVESGANFIETDSLTREADEYTASFTIKNSS